MQKTCPFIVQYKDINFMLFFPFPVTGDDPSEPYTTFSMQPFEDHLPEEIYPETTTPTATTTTTTTTTTTINGDSKERIYNGLNDKLIPIYCSILAAVVVGLVAFIIFKRWGEKKKGQILFYVNCGSNTIQTEEHF